MVNLGPKGSTGLVAKFLVINLGGLVAPQLVSTFLDMKRTNYTTPDEYSSSDNQNGTDMLSISNASGIELHNMNIVTADIEYTFGIISIFLALSALSFLVMFVFESRVSGTKYVTSKRTTWREWIINCAACTCTGDHNVKKLIFLTGLNFVIFNVVGVENTVTSFLYSFTLEGAHDFSPGEAANFNSAYFLCAIVGLAINTGLSTVLGIQYLVTVELITTVLTALILLIFGHINKLVYIVFTCTFGMFHPSLYALSLAWASLYIDMTVEAYGFAFLSNACGSVLYIWLTGTLIDMYGFYLYQIMLFAGTLISILAFGIVMIFGRCFAQDLKSNGYFNM